MDECLFEAIILGSDADKIATEKYLTTYYRQKGNTIFKAAELAESNLLNFVEFANRAIHTAADRNVPYFLSIVTREVVVRNADYSDVKALHANLLQMDWREFEHLSGELLEFCFGAVDVKVTQASADGGVDFEGRLPIKAIAASRTYGFVEVYGQSKRYASNVGIYDIKSFVAFANSKKRNFVHPPQLFIFLTTADYAPGARAEINENGFIALSGFQLAYLIYLQRASLVAKSVRISQLLTG